MNCARNLELLGPYVDGELEAAWLMDVERHLEDCAFCRQARSRLDRLRTSITNSAPGYKAPAALLGQVRKDLGIDQPPVRIQTRPWRIFATAATLALLGTLAWLTVDRHQQSTLTTDSLAKELVWAHVRSTQVDHLLDVTSSDQHTVKPWFSGKLDFALPVEDFAAQGFALQGGRLDYIAGHPAAVLIYRHKRHIINCFVWPAAAAAPLPQAAQGYSLFHFTDRGLSWHLVSDASPQTLEELARNLRSRAATAPAF